MLKTRKGLLAIAAIAAVAVGTGAWKFPEISQAVKLTGAPEISKEAQAHILHGDKTGGGSGLPFSSELPNGWSVRFSASPIYNVNKEHIEFGIEPDIFVSMTENDKSKGKDTIIEKAREVIRVAGK